MEKKNKFSLIAPITAVILIVGLLVNIIQVFRLTSDLTLDAGRYHLESISGALESSIGDAETLAMKLGLQAQTLLEDKEALEEFIYSKKAETLSQVNGCFNVYMAGSDWSIIPDFNRPADYDHRERDWYKGARRNQGAPFVTAPYMDAMTGTVCFTVSVLLGDMETVLALDYTMDLIQSHILQMYENNSRFALIVTGDGIIAGCSNVNLIGAHLGYVLPEYASVFSLVKSRKSYVTSRLTVGFHHENLFATASGFGWYLIVSENDWSLYKQAYVQLIGSAVFTTLLTTIIIILFSFSNRRQQAIQRQLKERDEVLARIEKQLFILLYEEGNFLKSQTDQLIGLKSAGREILSGIQRLQPKTFEEKKTKQVKDSNEATLRMNKRFRTRILLLLCLVVVVSTGFNLSISLKWGREKIRREINSYDYTLSEWVSQQKSILDMFCSVISTNPDMLDDYEGTVDYLNRITLQYPEISVTYMTNPDRDPTVYMNNGWLPPQDWHVEERQWYIDTLASKEGWTISAPYYDEQTGLYCVTFAEQVHDNETGEFLGNFGIDFFLDKLIDILGGSYSDNGYAFLTDMEGVILNHPNGSYQMTEQNVTNVSELPYSQVKPDGSSSINIRDYDGALRIVTAKNNAQSRFTVYEAVSFYQIYGPSFLSAALIFLVLLSCAIMVFRALSALILWQDQMNARIQEAADTAIAAGKAKSRFLAQMSHEIRTPINAVLGMNEMILRESKDEAILDYAFNIQTAGKTLLSLINSILDFSKIEEGKMEIIPVDYDTTSVINNLVASISERAKNKNLELVVSIDPTIPSRLIGDDVRISQVIMNLLTNAVKYTEKGSVYFSLTVTQKGPKDLTLRAEVRDTGIGIKQEDLSRLFESFERLDEVRNHSIEGTGLGMSIVTRLLSLMGSKLEVESVYGQGSTFSFYLKQNIADDKPIGDYEKRLENSRLSIGGETLLAEGAKVLVVDDNQMNLKVAKNLLKLFGIVPTLADSGYEAIDLIRKEHYHLVFLDHMMPQLDGVETLNILHQENLLKEDTKVIVLTANAVNGAKEEYLAAGFDAYLSKPIDVNKLEEMLIQYLPGELCSFRETAQEQTPVLSGSGQEGSKKDSDKTIEKNSEKNSESKAEDALKGAQRSAEAPGPRPQYDSPLLTSLQEAGFDIPSALQYVAGDESLYLELSTDFATNAPAALAAIRQDFVTKDWKDYEIRVHALKSTAKQIGAMVLSQAALDQEQAAKSLLLIELEKGGEPLLSLYEQTRLTLCQILGVEESSEEVSQEMAPWQKTLLEVKDSIEDFEPEQAAALLRPLLLQEELDPQIRSGLEGVLKALESYDTFTAGDLLEPLLSRKPS